MEVLQHLQIHACRVEPHVLHLLGFLVIQEIPQVIKIKAIHKLLYVNLFAETASLNVMKNVRIKIRLKTTGAQTNASFHGDMQEDKQESFSLTFT